MNAPRSKAVYMPAPDQLVRSAKKPLPRGGRPDPIPLFGPPEGGVSRLFHDGGLVAPSGLINEIGTLCPIAPCGRTSL